MSSLAKIVMRPRGNYKATDTYLSLDWVRYLGKVWVSKIDNNIGHTPEEGEYWALLVQDGSGGSGGDAYWGGITGELEDQTDLKEALDVITDSVELKQDILDTQTPYSQKGTSTKVPQITTNELGQVTAITEVNIAQYSLPTASTETLGGVKVDGETILIDNNGVISSVGGTGTGDMLKSDYDTNSDYKVDAADVADTLSGLTATITELNYSDGVTSNIQEQLDNRPKTDELHSVAFSGDYDDLNNTPTIPTVVVDKIQDEGVHIADITVSGIKTELYAPTSSGGSTAWGQITGTLSNQSDLQAALDGIDSALDNKVDVVSGKGLSTNDYDNTAKGIVDTVTSNLASKVNISQGASNVGKILKVNSSGNLELAQYSEGAQIEDTTTSTTSVWSSNKVNSELDDKINEPSSEGTNGQVLTTDGNGGRSWTTVQSGSGTSWGQITGDIEDQTDLSNVLTDKLSLSETVEQTINSPVVIQDNSSTYLEIVNIAEGGTIILNTQKQAPDIRLVTDDDNYTYYSESGIDYTVEGVSSSLMFDDVATKDELPTSQEKASWNNKIDNPSVAGTNGQVLTSNGTGGATWENPAGGGHEMYKALSELPTDSDGNVNIPSSDEHVMSAYAITHLANKFTDRIVISALVTEQSGTGIGTWCTKTIWTTTDEADWIGARTGEEAISDLLKISANNEEIELAFSFEIDNNEPITLGGYQLDTTTGRLCIKFGNKITKNNKIAIDITRTTNVN